MHCCLSDIIILTDKIKYRILLKWHSFLIKLNICYQKIILVTDFNLNLPKEILILKDTFKCKYLSN